MDFFRGRARTLADVEGITSVRVVGRLRASTPHTSPFTGRRGAVFGWTFWVNRRRATVPSTLDVIEDERLLERTRRLGARALERLRAIASRHPLVADVRGVGLLLGLELRRADGSPARDEAERVMYGCLARGLSFKVGQGNVITLSPPLVIPESDLDRALDILDEAIGAVEAGEGT